MVLDTNVLISALLNPYGKPSKILKMIMLGRLEVVVNENILGEYLEVAMRPRFNLPADEVKEVLGFIRMNGIPAPPYAGPSVNLPDPDDDHFLEAAFATNSDALVTGNIKHFPAKLRRGTRVLTPDQFIQYFEAAEEKS